MREWLLGKKSVNNYQSCMFEGLNERSQIHFQNEDRKALKNNEVDNS